MRGIIVSDLHCGHFSGLTPPDWHWQSTDERTHVGKLGTLQREIWSTFHDRLEPPYDFAFVLGDCVDGPGKKNGSTEHVAVSQDDQTEMATACLQELQASAYYMVRGTGYHVGVEDESEDDIAAALAKTAHVEIADQLFPEVQGITFDLRHHTGKTSVPHSATTGPGKSHIHNMLWHLKGMQPLADVTIRGHIHEYTMIRKRGWTGITCPALQALGSKYARRLDSQVDFGFLELEITEEGDLLWDDSKVCEVNHQAKTTTVFSSTSQKSSKQ